MAPLDIKKLRYMLITDQRVAQLPLEEVVEQALRAGFTAVQLREPDLHAAELYPLARQLREITAGYNAALIVNDRADVALAVEADAVQLPWHALPPRVARKTFGERMAIGVSAHNVAECRLALRNRADYCLYGPVFPTPSKEGLVPVVGTESLRAMAATSSIPIIAVGGIVQSNIAEVFVTRAAGAAVIRAVMATGDPYRAARGLIVAVEQAREAREADEKKALQTQKMQAGDGG